MILEASLRMLKNRSASPVASRTRSVSPSPSGRKFLCGSGISKVLSAIETTSAPPQSPQQSHTSTSDTLPKARSDSKLTVDNSTSETVHSFIVTNSSLRLSDLLAKDPPAEQTGSVTEFEQRSNVSRGRGRERSPSCTTGSVYGSTALLRRSNSELRLLAQSGIERSRSASASRKRREQESELRRTFLRSPCRLQTTDLRPVEQQPFTPLLISEAQSSRILSKTKSTFQERNLQSVENKFIRNVISKRTGSPGPGYYSNLSNSNALSPSRVRPSSCSPNRALPGGPNSASKGVSVVRQASPGHRGYSFNKEPLNRLQRQEQPPDKVTDLMDTLTRLGSTLRLNKSSSRNQVDVLIGTISNE